ncbi:hypothetical protein FRB97_005152 [Tulasnella sp. 331]|nr:hypothetical protein FRB97_005152 [Tulasnella sp. 331]
MQAGIWGVVLCLIVASLPRAFMRWRHPSIRSHGMMLKASKPGTKPPSTSLPGPSSPQSSNASLQPALQTQGNQASLTNSAQKEKADNANVQVQELPFAAGEDPMMATTHSRIASWGSIFYPVYQYLEKPVWWAGYSLGLSLAFAIYSGIISFGIFYHNLPASTGFGPRRAGWVFMGQVPFVMFLSTKNNVLGFVLGMGYEKLNVWHRWVGKTMFVALMAHVIGYLVLFNMKKELTSEVPTLYDGWIAFAGFLLLSLFSLPAVRTSAYRIFWHAHWVGYILLFVGVSFHAEHTWHYAVAGVGIIATDHVFRFFKTELVTVNLTAVPELRCTRIEVPHLTRGWRAGQHVRLRAASTQMGVASLFEAHPFTISSVGKNPRGEGLVLYAKACGDWTNRLYEIASSATSTSGTEKMESTVMRMIMEGPYGGPGHDVLSTFSSAFLVAGGSGVTWGLSMVEEIIRDAELQRASTKLIHLVWVVQDPSSLAHFVDLLTTLLNRASRLGSLNITISIFYTRAISNARAENLQTSQLPANIRLIPGRPRLEAMFNEFVDQTKGLASSKSDLSGLVIGMCGPTGLRDSVEKAGRSIPSKKRDSIGGVEVVIEAFGW